jgi:hypothetical protein
MKTIRGYTAKNPTMSTSTFASGSSTSAGRMKLKSGVNSAGTRHRVEGGKIITTTELLRSINDAADRFLRGDRVCRKQPV